MQLLTSTMQRDISLVKDRLTGDGLSQLLEPHIRKFMSQRDEMEQNKVMR